MSDWKDLYSEVKKRKMEALNKKDVVKAVEKHGKILAVKGKFEKPKKVIEYMYASEKREIGPSDVLKADFTNYDVVLIGCPGTEIPTSAFPKIRDYVVQNGGWIITTDWCVRSIVENIFPGFIRWNEKRTDDVVVPCQIIEPTHPFLEGVLGEISQSKWQTHDMKNTKKEEFSWWLENRSFPIQVLNYQAVRVLIASQEIKDRWGESPVFMYFDYGNTGGRIIHMISHTHLQKGGAKGKFASALILTNILDEKVSQKVGIKPRSTPKYVADWDSATAPQQPSQGQVQDDWVSPPAQSNYGTPASTGDSSLTGTSQIVEVNVNSGQFSFATKCEYCGYDFGEFQGKVYKCQACEAPYHDNCINMQINEGVCKRCGRILLW